MEKSSPFYSWLHVFAAFALCGLSGIAAAAQTTATFEPTPGSYVLEVTMTDERGLASLAKTLTVQVRRR